MNPMQGGQPIDQTNPVNPQGNPVAQPVGEDQTLQSQPAFQSQPLEPQQQQSPQPQPVANPAGAQPAQMPQLNDQFLVEVGLGKLPIQERQGMIQQMRKTLEANVGMEIYKNLQENQLQEFEGFMPLNDEAGNVINSQENATMNAQKWMDTNIQGWRENQGIQNYINSNDPNAPQLTAQVKIQNFAAMNWLQRNFPRYREVVANELNKLMLEVRNNVPRILEAVLGSQSELGQAPQAVQQPQQPPQFPQQ